MFTGHPCLRLSAPWRSFWPQIRSPNGSRLTDIKRNMGPQLCSGQELQCWSWDRGDTGTSLQDPRGWRKRRALLSNSNLRRRTWDVIPLRAHLNPRASPVLGALLGLTWCSCRLWQDTAKLWEDRCDESWTRWFDFSEVLRRTGSVILNVFPSPNNSVLPRSCFCQYLGRCVRRAAPARSSSRSVTSHSWR